jgi:hypothetical protein
LPRGGVITPKD